MKKSEIYKYPRNILIPLILFVIGMAVVFIIYRINSVDVTQKPNLNTTVKLPINTKANFIVDTTVETGERPDKITKINFKGVSSLNIDLANGSIVLEKIDLTSPSITLSAYKIKTTPIKVKLNPKYPSTGKIQLDTDAIDMSLDILLDFNYKNTEKKSYFTSTEINLTLPLSGTIDRTSGIIKLSGEATIPPDKISVLLPVSIKVIATTNQKSIPKVVNPQEN